VLAEVGHGALEVVEEQGGQIAADAQVDQD
jgi:hypothetical protein